MDLAAGIIGISSFGLQLSSTLYTYSATAIHASEDIPELAGHITLTAQILKSVASTISSASTTDLISNEAKTQARDVMKRCEGLFSSISATLDKKVEKGKDGSVRVKKSSRLAWPLKEGRFDGQKRKLEGLKVDLLLLLNVLQLAERYAKGGEALPKPKETPEGEAIIVLQAKQQQQQRQQQEQQQQQQQIVQQVPSEPDYKPQYKPKEPEVSLTNQPIAAVQAESLDRGQPTINAIATPPTLQRIYAVIGQVSPALKVEDLSQCSNAVSNLIASINAALDKPAFIDSHEASNLLRQQLLDQLFTTTETVRQILRPVERPWTPPSFYLSAAAPSGEAKPKKSPKADSQGFSSKTKHDFESSSSDEYISSRRARLLRSWRARLSPFRTAKPRHSDIESGHTFAARPLMQEEPLLQPLPAELPAELPAPLPAAAAAAAGAEVADGSESGEEMVESGPRAECPGIGYELVQEDSEPQVDAISELVFKWTTLDEFDGKKRSTA